MGSPPIGTSMMTFTSCGGFLPIAMASMRMKDLLCRKPNLACKQVLVKLTPYFSRVGAVGPASF